MNAAGRGSRAALGFGLMLMSFSSGCMDILSYRFLGDVFTSAMTGNIALMGLSLGHGDVAAAVRNVSALAGFVAGLGIGAWLLRRGVARRSLLLAVAAEAALLLGFALLWRLRSGAAERYVLIGLSAIGMGLQSAVAYRIGLRGVSTTYFTGTLSSIAFGLAEPHAPGEQVRPKLRRVAWPVLTFLAYLGGAVSAGWSVADMQPGKLPIGLPALPCAAAVVLGIIVAATAPRQAQAS